MEYIDRSCPTDIRWRTYGYIVPDTYTGSGPAVVDTDGPQFAKCKNTKSVILEENKWTNSYSMGKTNAVKPSTRKKNTNED